MTRKVIVGCGAAILIAATIALSPIAAAAGFGGASSTTGQLQLEKSPEVRSYEATLEGELIQIRVFGAKRQALGGLEVRNTADGVHEVTIELSDRRIDTIWNPTLPSFQLFEDKVELISFTFRNGDWDGDPQSWAYLEEYGPLIEIGALIYDAVYVDWSEMGARFTPALYPKADVPEEANSTKVDVSGCGTTRWGNGLGTRRTNACRDAKDHLDRVCKNMQGGQGCCWTDPEGCDCFCVWYDYLCACSIEGKLLPGYGN